MQILISNVIFVPVTHMEPVEIISEKQFKLTLNRLAFQLIENHNDFSDTVIIGLQPRGIYLAHRLQKRLADITNNSDIQTGSLDITFYRDDFRRREKPVIPSATNIDFIVENKNVVLVDDVFYTGRTVRSGLDAMLSFGRPGKVELLVLIERRFNAQLPLKPDYVGWSVDSISSETVSVEWEETDGKDSVKLYRSSENG